MRRKFTALVFACVALLSACSYISDFVVVNESDEPIEVSYKIRESAYEVFQEIAKPAKIAEADLRGSNKHWQELEAGNYRLDRGTRTIAVQVMPHEALRLEGIPNYSEASDADNFKIEEVLVRGSHDEVRMQGNQVRKRFMKESVSLYVFTYK